MQHKWAATTCLRSKLSGSVTIRNYNAKDKETTVAVIKGELKENLYDVAVRLGVSILKEQEGNLSLVDAQGINIFSKLVDKGVYYLQEEGLCKTGDNCSQNDEPVKSVEPDVSVAWAFDKRVLLHQPGTHRSPETPYRLERALEMLQEAPHAIEMLPNELLDPLGKKKKYNLPFLPDINHSCYILPRLASIDEVLGFQDPTVYRDFLETGRRLGNLSTDVYCYDQVSSVAIKVSCAAVIDASKLVLKSVDQCRSGITPSTAETLFAFCLVRPPGHHCTASKPSGFCLVNNVAIAAQQVLNTTLVAGNTPRIAILDLDVHFGEGTASFVDNYKHTSNNELFPLLYLSLHRYDKGDFYPFHPAGETGFVGTNHVGSIVNVAVNTNAQNPERCYEVISDFLFQKAFSDVFLPKLSEFAPDLVLLSLGFDAAYGDPLGKMAVEGGFSLAVSKLKEWCLYGRTASLAPTELTPSNLLPKQFPVGLIVILEGGYNPESVANGVVSVAYALTYPPRSQKVLQFSNPQVPKVWHDLRRKQERKRQEWKRIQSTRDETMFGANEPESFIKAPLLVEDDATLLVKHMDWCDFVINNAISVHQRALA